MQLVTFNGVADKPVVLNVGRIVGFHPSTNAEHTEIYMDCGSENSEAWTVFEPMAEVVRKLKEA